MNLLHRASLPAFGAAILFGATPINSNSEFQAISFLSVRMTMVNIREMWVLVGE